MSLCHETAQNFLFLPKVVCQHPSACAQAGLLVLLKDLVFQPTVEVLYGLAFCRAQDMARLQQAFFSFESGFELAASPVPHVLQRAFCAARSYLLTSFRQVSTPRIQYLFHCEVCQALSKQPCWPTSDTADEFRRHQNHLAAGRSLHE